MMYCPQRRSQNPEPETWNSELGTFNRQSGFLLVTAIFLLVILAALGAFILTISGTQQTSSALDVQGARAYQAARAGIEWASDQLLITAAGGCAGYLYQRSVTIDRTKVPNTDQSNFPVLFSGTYSFLATVANGGKVTNASGFDIIVTSDSAGTTKLDHEIESYNASGAVTFWVRVPTVSTTTDTVIYLCYGNAAITTSQENKTAVWSNGFESVYHLHNAFTDSTGIHAAGTNSGTTSSTGVAANGRTFNGSSQYINTNWISNYGASQDLTWEGWFKVGASGIGGSDDIMGIEDRFCTDPPTCSTFAGDRSEIRLAIRENAAGSPNPIDAYDTYIRPDTGSLYTGAPSISPTGGQWHHAVLLRNGSTGRLYLDGSEVHSGAVATGALTFPTAPNNTLLIGAQWETDTASTTDQRNYFEGDLDEVRTSTTVRSADWIKTVYNNQSSPSTFYTLGTESASGGAFTTACNPGPTTQNVTGMGGTLSGFTAAVTCSSTTYTEAGATVTVYQITSTGEKGTVGTLDRVERQLQVTLNK